MCLMWTECRLKVPRSGPRRRVSRVRGRSWTVLRIGLRSGFSHAGGIHPAVLYPLPGSSHSRRSRLAGQHHQYGLISRRFLRWHRIRGLCEDMRDLARMLGVDLTGGQCAPSHRHHRRRLPDARPRFLPRDPQRPHQHRLSAAETLVCRQTASLYLAHHRQHPRMRTTRLPLRSNKFSGQLFVGKPPLQHLLCGIHILTVPRTYVRCITRSDRLAAPSKYAGSL